MKIVILDNNSDRKEKHKKFWDTHFPEYDLTIYGNLSIEKIDELDCDWLLVHVNNEETQHIEEEIENCKYSRVFFAGDREDRDPTEYIDEKLWYVAESFLNEFMKDKLK